MNKAVHPKTLIKNLVRLLSLNAKIIQEHG